LFFLSFLKHSIKGLTANYLLKSTSSTILDNIFEVFSRVISPFEPLVFAVPCFIACDLIEEVVRYSIDDPDQSETMGTIVGVASYATVGGAIGGPPGAVVGTVVYFGKKLLNSIWSW
jgi:hypothetical protein